MNWHTCMSKSSMVRIGNEDQRGLLPAARRAAMTQHHYCCFSGPRGLWQQHCSAEVSAAPGEAQLWHKAGAAASGSCFMQRLVAVEGNVSHVVVIGVAGRRHGLKQGDRFVPPCLHALGWSALWCAAVAGLVLGAAAGGVMDRVVAQLLAEVDGVQSGSKEDLYIIGATNR